MNERPKLRKIATDIDSINGNLEEICANLERITCSLARLTELAEDVANIATAPSRFARRLIGALR
jgi:prefoldin subunit 5